MRNPINKLTNELMRKVSKDIDVFIVQRIVDLFSEGVLELAYELPEFTKEEYPLTSLDTENVTIRVNQNVWLRFKGDDLLYETQRILMEAKDELEYYAKLEGFGAPAARFLEKYPKEVEG